MCWDCDYWGDCDYYPECAEGWLDEAIEYYAELYGDEGAADADYEYGDLEDLDFCEDCQYFGDCADFGCA